MGRCGSLRAATKRMANLEVSEGKNKISCMPSRMWPLTISQYLVAMLHCRDHPSGMTPALPSTILLEYLAEMASHG